MRRFVLAIVMVAATGPAVASQSRAANQPVVENLKALCALNEGTDRSETAEIVARVAAAADEPRTNQAFWHFLTDPSTPYLDRLAAARRSGPRIGLDQLPVLWAAVAEFNHVPHGVLPSPCEVLWSARWSPSMWADKRTLAAGVVAETPAKKSLLGHPVTLPVSAVDYPVTPDDRNRSPWLWQMQRVLPIVMAEVQKYYADPERYPAMAEVAFRWAPTDSYEFPVRERALLAGPRNADWVRTILRLALDDVQARPRGSTSGILLDLYVYGDDSYHLEELVHTAQIIFLQRTSDTAVAANAAYQAARLFTTKYSSFSKVLRPLRTSTAVLAIARWAQNPAVELATRYSFACSIGLMVDAPPFRPDPGFVGSTEAMRAHAPEIAQALNAFDVWLERERPRLEREAAAEHPRLAALAAELRRTID